MVDIAKCSGNGCEKRDSCYRYVAPADTYYQSYFQTPPIEDGECQFYWNTEKEIEEVVRQCLK